MARLASSYDVGHPGDGLSGAAANPVKKNAPALTLPQAQFLVAHVIPRRRFDAHWVLEVLAYWQDSNYRAYRSHRKRRLARLNQLE